MYRKKGLFLVGTVVYLIIVIVFIAMLFAFIFRQSSNTAQIEEKTAKEIALMIDAAKPNTMITIEMDEALKKNEGIPNPIRISDNLIVVELSKRSRGGYKYSFFNDVSVDVQTTKIGKRSYLVLKIR